MLTDAIQGPIARMSRFAGRLRRQHVLMLAPCLLAMAYLLGGLPTLAGVSLILPVALLTAPTFAMPQAGGTDGLTGLAQRSGIVDALDHGLRHAARSGRSTGAIVVEIDRFKLLEERHDRTTIERILTVTAQRLQGTMRDSDLTARLDGPTFAVSLSPARRLDLEAVIQLAGRLQRALAEPIAFDGTNIYVTASIGFSLAARYWLDVDRAILRTNARKQLAGLQRRQE